MRSSFGQGTIYFHKVLQNKMSNIPNIIAIDGPAASGKTTVAEILARRYGLIFFDTGVMYRAVTLAVLNQHLAMDDEDAITKVAETAYIDIATPSQADGRKMDVLLDGLDVTWDVVSQEVNKFVSTVSAYSGVRKALTDQQRRIALNGMIVMVGRDIGTVVAPDADLKIFLDASLEVRAKRRYEEEITRNPLANMDMILSSLKQRDSIDTTREIAPLRPADDAIIIDTNEKSIEQVVQLIAGFIESIPQR
jgi:CMP/dCMP kinase